MNNDKLIQRAVKTLGDDSTNELMSLSAERLEAVIIAATREVEDTKAELEANPAYQAARENLKALRSGLSEVKKINNVRIQLAAALLNERGQKVAAGA